MGVVVEIWNVKYEQCNRCLSAYLYIKVISHLIFYNDSTVHSRQWGVTKWLAGTYFRASMSEYETWDSLPGVSIMVSWNVTLGSQTHISPPSSGWNGNKSLWTLLSSVIRRSTDLWHLPGSTVSSVMTTDWRLNHICTWPCSYFIFSKMNFTEDMCLCFYSEDPLLTCTIHSVQQNKLQ